MKHDLKLGEKVMIVFEDGNDNALVVVDDGGPTVTNMADVLVLIWSAIRKNYYVIQQQAPTEEMAGVVYLYSPELAE